MSWDVLLLNAPAEIRNVSDMPDDFKSTLGPRAEVLAALRRHVPGIDLSDPAWGLLDGPDFSIEFNLGGTEITDSIALHVRGADAAILPIAELVRATGWRALDLGNCEFLDFSRGVPAGFRAWRAFADRAIARQEKSGGTVVRNPKVGRSRLDAIVCPGPSPPRRWWRFWR